MAAQLHRPRRDPACHTTAAQGSIRIRLSHRNCENGCILIFGERGSPNSDGRIGGYANWLEWCKHRFAGRVMMVRAVPDCATNGVFPGLREWRRCAHNHICYLGGQPPLRTFRGLLKQQRFQLLTCGSLSLKSTKATAKQIGRASCRERV